MPRAQESGEEEPSRSQENGISPPRGPSWMYVLKMKWTVLGWRRWRDPVSFRSSADSDAAFSRDWNSPELGGARVTSDQGVPFS